MGEHGARALHHTHMQCSGFHLDPESELASRDEGAPREGRTRGAAGGVVPINSCSCRHHKPPRATNRSQNLKMLVLAGVVAISDFGTLKTLARGFLRHRIYSRLLLALNSRNFGAHLSYPVPPVEGAWTQGGRDLSIFCRIRSPARRA